MSNILTVCFAIHLSCKQLSILACLIKSIKDMDKVITKIHEKLVKNKKFDYQKFYVSVKNKNKQGIITTQSIEAVITKDIIE